MTTNPECCPDCGGELGVLSHLAGGAVLFCLGDCYEKKPELKLKVNSK